MGKLDNQSRTGVRLQDVDALNVSGFDTSFTLYAEGVYQEARKV
jgi:hypothetical protein